MGRWDRFHEARRVTAKELLEREVVDTLWSDLAVWPPPIAQWNDERLHARYAAALAPDCPRPGLTVFLTALKLTRWELEREFEALDAFARNERDREVTGSERERLCLELLHRWLTDVMHELLEATSALGRPDLVACLNALEARFLAPD